jgi:DNA-binding GntR family transcriptional regulator
MGLEALPMRTRVADDVYSRLLEAILSHDLAPGARLSVPALASMLGVSRTPVREAVLRLIREGLAVEEPRRGAMLIGFAVEDLVHIYEVREVLEGQAARLAALRATDQECDDMRDAVKAHAEAVAANDVARHFDLDMRFHMLTRQATRNADLAAILDQIQTKIRVAMITTVVSFGPAEALADHQRILAQIAARDPDGAEDAARRHIQRLRKLLEATEPDSYRVGGPATNRGIASRS